MKILAVDFGLKRMGFAVGNTIIRVATPIQPLQRKNLKQDIQYIKNIIDEYDIGKIIIGYPLNMDGSKSATAVAVEKFSQCLQQQMELAVEFVDERLTSFEAEESLKELHPNYKKRKQMLDSVSASILAQRYMEKLAGGSQDQT